MQPEQIICAFKTIRVHTSNGMPTESPNLVILLRVYILTRSQIVTYLVKTEKTELMAVMVRIGIL